MLFSSALNHLTHVIWFAVPETVVSAVIGHPSGRVF
jgi:hypothetical protein